MNGKPRTHSLGGVRILSEIKNPAAPAPGRGVGVPEAHPARLLEYLVSYFSSIVVAVTGTVLILGWGYAAAYGQSAAYPTSGRADGYDARESSPGKTRKGLAGLFEGDGKLDWPLGLRILPPAEETEALRQEVETFLRAAVKGTGTGKAPASALNEARLAIARLQRLLARHADRLPVSTYTVTEAKRYLRRLKLFAKGLE